MGPGRLIIIWHIFKWKACSHMFRIYLIESRGLDVRSFPLPISASFCPKPFSSGLKHTYAVEPGKSLQLLGPLRRQNQLLLSEPAFWSSLLLPQATFPRAISASRDISMPTIDSAPCLRARKASGAVVTPTHSQRSRNLPQFPTLFLHWPLAWQTM